MFPCFLWSSWRNRHYQIKWLYGNTILLFLFTHLKWSIPKLQWICTKGRNPIFKRLFKMGRWVLIPSPQTSERLSCTSNAYCFCKMDKALKNTDFRLTLSTLQSPFINKQLWDLRHIAEASQFQLPSLWNNHSNNCVEVRFSRPHAYKVETECWATVPCSSNAFYWIVKSTD